MKSDNKTEKVQPCGILCVDKPQGYTSHDVVNIIRKLYDTKRVGHTGTLDPMATGLLIVLVGEAAKASDLLLGGEKHYIAGLKLGITTDTEDTSGKILSESCAIPDEASVRAVCGGFVGEIMQIPPMYSAIKIGGKKLVDLARNGVTVEREPRSITIRSLDVSATDTENEYILDVICSKGTYIRTLCADIGKKLGCGGVMSSLRRVGNHNMTIDDAYPLEELRGFEHEKLIDLLIPVEKAFADLPTVMLPPFFERLALNGCEIYQKKLGSAFTDKTLVRMCGSGGFFAVGEVSGYPEGSAIKAIRRFDR